MHNKLHKSSALYCGHWIYGWFFVLWMLILCLLDHLRLSATFCGMKGWYWSSRSAEIKQPKNTGKVALLAKISVFPSW